MTQRHLVLIVEDDAETASDLHQILLSLDCDSIVADNRKRALEELRKKSFCLVLLGTHSTFRLFVRTRRIMGGNPILEGSRWLALGLVSLWCVCL